MKRVKMKAQWLEKGQGHYHPTSLPYLKILPAVGQDEGAQHMAYVAKHTRL